MGTLGIAPAPRGAWFPCWGYPVPHSSTTPCKGACGALVTNTPLLRKGEGFSTCLSAFLNPGQVLCFSRAHPHSSSSRDAGEDPSCLWQWVCSEQQKHPCGTPPSRNTDPRKQDRNVCLFAAGQRCTETWKNPTFLRKEGNCSLIRHVEVNLCADSRGIWAVPRGVVIALWVTSQL